jgi:hypothetical protein
MIVTHSSRRKGRAPQDLLSQNEFGVVHFDFTIQFALTGWEGLAHDGEVLRYF